MKTDHTRDSGFTIIEIMVTTVMLVFIFLSCAGFFMRPSGPTKGSLAVGCVAEGICDVVMAIETASASSNTFEAAKTYVVDLEAWDVTSIPSNGCANVEVVKDGREHYFRIAVSNVLIGGETGRMALVGLFRSPDDASNDLYEARFDLLLPE